MEKVIGSKRIKGWEAFLSSGHNKSRLIRFLTYLWIKNVSVIGDLLLNVGLDTSCKYFQSKRVSAELNDLLINYKDAESMVLLHPKHISKRINMNIVIQKLDVAVFVTCPSMLYEINGNLIICASSQNRSQTTFI